MSQEIKFKKIYTEIQERLKDSILSLWATGDAQFQDYLSNLFEQEKLLAEPVFQNTFPWTPAKESFGDLNNLFQTSFIEKLDKIKGEYEFPKNPYLLKSRFDLHLPIVQGSKHLLFYSSPEA